VRREGSGRRIRTFFSLHLLSLFFFPALFSLTKHLFLSLSFSLNETNNNNEQTDVHEAAGAQASEISAVKVKRGVFS